MTSAGRIRRLVFTVLVLLFFVAVLVSTNNFRLRVAGYFPGFAALLGVVTVGLLLIVEIRKALVARSLDPVAVTPAVAPSIDGTATPGLTPGEIVVGEDEGEGGDIDPHQLRRTLLWLTLSVVLVALLGLLYGAGVFLLLFLRFEGRESWTYTLLATAAALGFLYGTADLFNLQWPESLIVILFF